MQKMEAAPDAVETPPYDMEVEDIGESEVSLGSSVTLPLIFSNTSSLPLLQRALFRFTHF